MSISFLNTPAEFQPVLSDGIYFTVSGSTYDPSTTFKFKYVYNLEVEGVPVFSGKCSPNPFGLGIIDLQQILETYTNSLPISYWDTTPIYTHQTFPFSRPANVETIFYQIKVGYEYADSAISPITGFTGYGNSIGVPSVASEGYKVFRSTMGTNPNATLQDFNIDPFVLSGTPQGVFPTTSGLFLTNAPRIQDIRTEDYFTLGFTNYYLWSGFTSTGLSEPYYSEYNFYDDQGALISTERYENLTTNGGGPRTICTNVYQNLFLIDPLSAVTEFNTLYVGAGPANIPDFPSGTTQYTVQLFGKFTGTTTPIPASPTPTPTQFLTPTPTPTPSSTPAGICSGCTEYQITYTGESVATVTIINCLTQLPQNILIQPNLIYNVCSCEFPLTEVEMQILTGGPCGPPTTPTPTPTPTNSCVCEEYIITNDTLFNDFLQYINCLGVPISQSLPANSATTICACQGTIETTYSEVQLLGPCVPPSPTRTPTQTPTPSSTPGCFLSWVITTCESTCSGGICTCSGGSSITVYTNCSVTDITDPDTEIYENTALTNPFTGDFVDSGSIYNSTGSGVTLVCVIGGPC
jgi:hypothetical protein